MSEEQGIQEIYEIRLNLVYLRKLVGKKNREEKRSLFYFLGKMQKRESAIHPKEQGSNIFFNFDEARNAYQRSDGPLSSGQERDWKRERVAGKWRIFPGNKQKTYRRSET